MAATVTFVLEPGPNTMTSELEVLAARAADMAPLFGAIYANFLELERRMFAEEGSPAMGGHWMALAPSTVAERERLGIGGAHPILDRTGASATGKSGRKRKTYGKTRGGRKGGALKRSLTEPGAPNAVFRPRLSEVFMGTSDPVAEYHDSGTDQMPARPLIAIGPLEEAGWAEIASEYLFHGRAGAEVLAGAGAGIGPVGL